MSENTNNHNNEGKQAQSLDRSVKALNKEQRIFDEGYGAVRKMAAKMVQNGATLADIIFHANQIWHEFKVGALTAGCPAAVANGSYVNQYDHEVTKAILAGDERYARGLDELRVAIFVKSYKDRQAGEE